MKVPRGRRLFLGGGMRHGARKVLLVDDEVVNRMALARLLSQLGVATVDQAADGAEALARAQTAAYDAVVCDIDMHPMDGIAFLRALRRRADSPNQRTPVIMLSKYSSGGMLQAAREAGAAAYIVKPVGRDDLLDKLARVAPAATQGAATQGEVLGR